jgi:hypothetical protein
MPLNSPNSRKRGVPSLTTPGVIYFLRAESPVIKIGFTKSTKSFISRLDALQSSSWEALTVIQLTRGSLVDEYRLHRRFKHLHIRGEWFRAEPELLAFVEGVTPLQMPERKPNRPMKGHRQRLPSPELTAQTETPDDWDVLADV